MTRYSRSYNGPPTEDLSRITDNALDLSALNHGRTIGQFTIERFGHSKLPYTLEVKVAMWKPTDERIRERRLSPVIFVFRVHGGNIAGDRRYMGMHGCLDACWFWCDQEEEASDLAPPDFDGLEATDSMLYFAAYAVDISEDEI